MAKTDEVWTQLATRIPKELHRRLVVEAIEEKLGRKAKPRKGTA